MARRPDARALLFERIRTSPPKFVHVVAVPYTVAVETSEDPLRIDHVFLAVEAPPFGRLRVSINTLSRLNRDAGFDSRVRLGIIASTYTEKPQPGLEECPGLDYVQIEKQHPLAFQEYEHAALADLFISKMKAAIRIEIWGELYAREHLGLHQLHSRRASCAVPLDLKNRDGSFKLYYPTDNLAEEFLIKFCGQ